jgi:hypothetical protein
MNELLALDIAPQTELIPTIFSFILCVLMSFILRSFYLRRSFSLTGKNHIGSILPILSMVVFLVIIVVKSSLALSLGLVGALSIVRFRTPIKEPEELVYLFLAIAIGLGYAAGQVFITTIIVLSILLIIYFFLSNRSLNKVLEYNLIINWKKSSLSIDEILGQLNPLVESTQLIRLDLSNDNNTAVFIVSPIDDSFLKEASEKIKALDNDSDISFFESKTNW